MLLSVLVNAISYALTAWAVGWCCKQGRDPGLILLLVSHITQ